MQLHDKKVKSIKQQAALDKIWDVSYNFKYWDYI